jgi:hypothetical protein
LAKSSGKLKIMQMSMDEIAAIEKIKWNDSKSLDYVFLLKREKMSAICAVRGLL